MTDQQADKFHTYQEIVQHGQAWRSALDDVATQADSLRALYADGEVSEVIFVGCGSTYYLSRAAAQILQGIVGVSCKALPASDVVLFPEIVLRDTSETLLIAVSRSGTTTETLKAVEAFKARTGRPVIGITCYPESTLVGLVDQAVVAAGGQEESIAQTRSFSSMLVAATAVARVLAGQPADDLYPDLIADSETNLQAHAALAQQLGEDRAIDRFFFLGGGMNYGLACEAMLKMKEMSLSYAEAFQFLEFRHGPMSMVNDRTLVVGLVSSSALPYEADVLREMRALGATTLAITPDALPDDAADFQMRIQDGYSDLDRGPLYLPMLQLLAFYRAVMNGLNPDKPQNLTAVVELDDNRFSPGR